MQGAGTHDGQIDLLYCDSLQNRRGRFASAQNGLALDACLHCLLAQLFERGPALVLEGLLLRLLRTRLLLLPAGLLRSGLHRTEDMQNHKTGPQREAGIDGRAAGGLRGSREIGCNEQSVEGRHGIDLG